MVWLEIVVLASSVFSILQALSFMKVISFPYISLISGLNIYFAVTKVCVLKWSIVLGVFGIIYAIASIFLLSKNADFMKYRLFMTGFYLLLTLLMLF